jgi:ubiquinone/menaquinone biosynthesis methyltransferase
MQPETIRAMFDRIAPTYDALNRTMSAGLDRSWRARAVRLLRSTTGPLLDLCAGTLDLSALLRAHFPDERIVALDFSAEMLARGKKKTTGVETVVGDATALPFDDASFGGIVCGFGVRNVREPARALREAHRVLRPGGVFVTLELFRPTKPSTRAFHSAFGKCAPVLGAMIARDRDAYAYLARSITEFFTRQEYEALLRREGFVNVRGQDVTLGVASIVRGEKPS